MVEAKTISRRAVSTGVERGGGPRDGVQVTGESL